MARTKTTRKTKSRSSRKTRTKRTGKTTKGKLFVGVDFGTYRTAVSTDSRKTEILSIVGKPRDAVASNFLKKEVLYGEDALKHKLALDLSRPIEDGVLRNSKDDLDAAKGLLKHALDRAGVLSSTKAKYGIIGVPAKASVFSQKLMTNIAKEFFDGVMIISEPFSVAYGINKLEHTLVVDIGAGTTDLCRVHGTLPASDDQISTSKAGDYIDNTLMDLIEDAYTDARLTKDMVRKWKEESSYMGPPPKRDIKVKIPVDATLLDLDITDEVGEACESIVPDIIEGIRTLVATYDPDFQEDLRNDILVAGGGSRIRGIKDKIAAEMELGGGAKISVVKDPIFAGSDGALKLAKDMPPDYWEQMK